MNCDLLYEAIGMLDHDIIESVEKAPQRVAPAKAAKPWVKWVVAAVVIAVFAIGTPVALNMWGVFRTDNIVTPGPDNSGGGNADSGIVTSVGGSGSSTERPDDPASSSGTPSGNGPSVQIEGEFIKDNMPAATYKINGKNRSFVYQHSSVVKIDGEAGYRVLDHYADVDGATISANAESGELVEYEAGDSNITADWPISESEAIARAKRIPINSDIGLEGIENASADVRYTDDRYYVGLKTMNGHAQLWFNKEGGLISLSVMKAPDNSSF